MLTVYYCCHYIFLNRKSKVKCITVYVNDKWKMLHTFYMINFSVFFLAQHKNVSYQNTLYFVFFPRIIYKLLFLDFYHRILRRVTRNMSLWFFIIFYNGTSAGRMCAFIFIKNIIRILPITIMDGFFFHWGQNKNHPILKE